MMSFLAGPAPPDPPAEGRARPGVDMVRGRVCVCGVRARAGVRGASHAARCAGNSRMEGRAEVEAKNAVHGCTLSISQLSAAPSTHTNTSPTMPDATVIPIPDPAPAGEARK